MTGAADDQQHAIRIEVSSRARRGRGRGVGGCGPTGGWQADRGADGGRGEAWERLDGSVGEARARAGDQCSLLFPLPSVQPRRCLPTCCFLFRPGTRGRAQQMWGLLPDMAITAALIARQQPRLTAAPANPLPQQSHAFSDQTRAVSHMQQCAAPIIDMVDREMEVEDGKRTGLSGCKRGEKMLRTEKRDRPRRHKTDKVDGNLCLTEGGVDQSAASGVWMTAECR